MKRAWPVIAMLIGLALIFVAPLAVGSAPAETFWTDEDQSQYQKASADFHAASYDLPSESDGARLPGRRSGYDPVAAKAKYSAAKAAWEQQRSRLENAQSRWTWLRRGCQFLGAVVAAAGIWGYVRGRNRTGG